MNPTRSLHVFLLAHVILETAAFIVLPGTSPSSTMNMANQEADEPVKRGGFFQAFGDFWEELDAFMDDAS